MSEFESPLLVWILLLPLFGAVVNGFLGKRLPRAAVGTIASGSVLGSFVLSLITFSDLQLLIPRKRILVQDLFQWIAIPELGIAAKLLVDPLTIVMLLIITGIGFLIHVYSTEYMEHDDAVHRYFAYLNLFVFSMLILVMGANLPMMFVGWEGVGLCSYLLIGFWFSDENNAKAGRKAFITNRVGDFGFLLGMFVIYMAVKTLDFNLIGTRLGVEQWPIPTWVVTMASLLLFVGAAGKSAQIPLYVWLPDAMAGPTPVSALIHAATMVTAGVYMIARLHLLFLLSPLTMAVVATIGALTALMAATIALTQNDIKKVLAYSTVSQLGFMFMGVGVGSFVAGVFHLMTHAFFKALLFLGSGSVIHGMDHAHGADDPQDIRTMGGLRHRMPITFWTFLLATAAIAGVPGFSGFFSKDEILWKSLSTALGSPLVWAIGSIAATLTAFYMTRLVILTFFGEYRGKPDTFEHVHDPGWRMTMPLVVLAVLSVVGGYIGLPHVFHLPNLLEHWLEPVFRFGEVKSLHHVPLGPLHVGEATAMGVSIVLAFFGIGLAWYMYKVRPELPGKLVAKVRPAYALLHGKYFVDEIYDWVIIRPLNAVSRIGLFQLVDRRVIDLAVEGTGKLMRGFGSALRLSQTGNLSTYLLYLLLGSLALIVSVVQL